MQGYHPYSRTSSASSIISQQYHHHVGVAELTATGQVVLVQAQIRSFTKDVHFGQSVTRRSVGFFIAWGLFAEGGVLLPRNGYISRNPTLQTLACASALQWAYYGRSSVHRRTT